MLKYLHIENIAVIEQSNIDFTQGFNVLSGETGAGKSIIIDSIYAVLGHRTSKELIRSGCDRARVCAVFDSLKEEAVRAFGEIGVSADDDDCFVIERTLSLNSGGFIKVNGVPVSATMLRNISPLLLNIHGQHDNQTLLDSDSHYIYLDRLAENSAELNEYRDEFLRFNSIRSRLKALEMDEDEKLRRIDILKFQIDELSNASLKIGELAELKSRLSLARNVGNKIKTLNSILLCLKECDEGTGAIELLRNALHRISVDKELSLENEVNLLQDTVENVNSVIDSISLMIDALSSDEYNIDKIEDRLAFLSNLSAKYGKDEEAMLGFLASAENELNTIMFNDEETEKLEQELIDSQEKLVKKASVLTATRKKASAVFENSVKYILNELNMPNVEILVEIEQGRYTKNGCDTVQFLFCANAGETKKPLAKIASGGELSRVMLAIKSVLAKNDDVYTLIFDEIDSGISGRTADKVGIQLKKVSKDKQVICVTHLAQIASVADNHLLISKDVEDGRTYTCVTSLVGEERVKEIARIMGGTQVSSSILASARELIENGNKI